MCASHRVLYIIYNETEMKLTTLYYCGNSLPPANDQICWRAVPYSMSYYACRGAKHSQGLNVPEVLRGSSVPEYRSLPPEVKALSLSLSLSLTNPPTSSQLDKLRFNYIKHRHTQEIQLIVW